MYRQTEFRFESLPQTPKCIKLKVSPVGQGARGTAKGIPDKWPVCRSAKALRVNCGLTAPLLGKQAGVGLLATKDALASVSLAANSKPAAPLPTITVSGEPCITRWSPQERERYEGIPTFANPGSAPQYTSHVVARSKKSIWLASRPCCSGTLSNGILVGTCLLFIAVTIVSSADE